MCHIYCVILLNDIDDYDDNDDFEDDDDDDGNENESAYFQPGPHHQRSSPSRISDTPRSGLWNARAENCT